MEEFKRFVESQRWTFARTYAEHAPHEYVVKGKCNVDDEEFVRMARFVDDNGFEAKFFSQTNSYYELDGYYYWTKYRDPEGARIINRCRKDDYEVSMRFKG